MARFSVRAGFRRDDGRVRWFVPLTLAFLLVSAGVALADTLEASSDEFVLDQSLDLGEVCSGEDAQGIVYLWMRRSGATATFANNATIELEVLAASAGLSATTPPDIVLPGNWESLSGIGATRGESDRVTSTVTLNTSDLGPFEGTIQFEASGASRQPPPPTSTRDELITVTAHIIDCAGVTYVTRGFKPPVATGDWNKARAGQSVSLRWNLWEDEPTVVNEVIDPVLNGDSYSIRSRMIACDSTSAGDLPEDNDGYAGSSGLRYDDEAVVGDASGQNVFVWQTSRAWGGTCRELVVMYAGADILLFGSDPPVYLTAKFDFRR